MNKSYNEKLHKKNASFYSDAEKKLVRKQDIIKGLKDAGYDVNDQIALILNVLGTMLDSIPASDYKTELKAALADRKEVKAEAKEN